MERDQDTSLVFACEPGAPHSEAYRYFIMHVMREIGSRFAAKVRSFRDSRIEQGLSFDLVVQEACIENLMNRIDLKEFRN